MKIVIVSLLLIAGGPAMADNTIDPDVQAVAEAYFDALQAGNSQALLSLFAGEERTRNEAQLSDPGYSSFLVNRYSGAHLEITDSGASGMLRYVDIAIWLNDLEAVRERLILEPALDALTGKWHIIGRKELSS